MIHEVFMPALSSTMTEGKIVSWVKSPGDKVEKGETVVVVESDKADMDVESFYEGYLAIITVPAGESAPVGAAIALVAETEAEIETAKQQATPSSPEPAVATAQKETAPAPEPVEAAPAAAQDTPSRRNGRIIVSPRARKLAKELKVDLGTLKGSGPHGRIVAEDVEGAAGKGSTPVPTVATTAVPAKTPIAAPPATPAAKPAAAATPAVPTAVPLGEVVPLNTLQNAVVRNMVASLQVPTYHVGYTITTDELDNLYKKIKSKGVTMTALLAKAVAVTLQKHPLVNASYTEQGIQYHSAINISVAVAMADGGLITPVLQKPIR
jgi:pyruvate dehydrogenase E2 component (dihydrolipoamide acetyltransferase)